MKYQIKVFDVKGAAYYVAIKQKVIFSHVKISCFRAKAHLVLHWCLKIKLIYLQNLDKCMKWY